jgi:DNA-binding Lrp family transcriptional regulator
MSHSTISPTSTSSPKLRVVRDESPPPYDGIPSARPRTVKIVPVTDDVGDTIIGTLGPSAFTVYWHLVRRSKNGQCAPSVDAITDAVKISRMHVTRMLAALEKDGWITRTARTNAYGMTIRTIYTIVEKPCTNGGNIAVTSREHDKPSDVTPLYISTTVTVPSVDPVPEEPEKVNTRSDSKKSAPKYTEAFETFWRSYPSGRGNKFPSFKHWQRMSDDDRDAAQLAIPKWKAAWGDVQFIPYCEKWLGERRWENDPPVGAKGEINHNAGGRGIWVG